MSFRLRLASDKTVMNIIFAPKRGRTRMTCRRADGTVTSADLGPSVPAHDFAHFIVERTLRLPTGFFVNIAQGYSIQQLSDAAIIRSLGTEPLVAEILARALGSLATGACTAGQFAELAGTELVQMGLRVPRGVNTESAMRMLEELRSMMERFAGLGAGEYMELQFSEAP
ncbi:MAG: hypothetical protein ACREU2_12080 [Steroidobacteraceae bacterium]